jgi:hypothetical protein
MRILLALLTVAAIASGTALAGAATPTTCKSVATPTGSSGAVQATRVTCVTARAVARLFATTGKEKKNWHCSVKGYEGGATVTCHDGTGSKQKRVRFQIAD